MKKAIIYVSNCIQCPNFDDVDTPKGDCICLLLKKPINEHGFDDVMPDCPLEDA